MQPANSRRGFPNTVARAAEQVRAPPNHLELAEGQRELISDAQFVSNPGCYPQGFILMIRPLIEAGLLSAVLPLRCHAVSGYSGGGRQMIEARQAFSRAEIDRFNSQLYALTLDHKHVPEMHTPLYWLSFCFWVPGLTLFKVWF